MLRSLIAGAIALGVLAADSSAQARTRHRDHQHHHHARVATQKPTHFSHDVIQGGGGLVSIARSQLGAGAVYGRHSLWCARFMNWTLARAGYRGTGSDLALSFLALPRTSPHVGAIAVLGRGRRAGHVGIVTGFDQAGNPIIVSGNHGHRVGEGVYPRRRVLAYVSPA